MRTVCLNGQWDFLADLDPRYHVYNPRVPIPTMVRPDVNRRHWRKVTVPGVWQKYAQRYDIFEGVCIFSREFDAGEVSAQAAARLRFSGVNYLARVFVNGQEAGSHETGYTEFVIDVTGKLVSGRNHVAVIVDNRVAVTKWPACFGYFNYGGIHRDVVLEIIDSPSLDDVQIETSLTNGKWMLKARGLVRFAQSGHSVRACCAGRNTAGDVTAGAFDLELADCPIEAWSPQSPCLYELALELRDSQGVVLDERRVRCGFRTIKVIDGRICLNDRPVHLKGICHVFDSEETGLVMTRGQIDRDISMLKSLGCNAVRTHYPMDRAFYEACDEAGLMVWTEPPIYCLHPPDDACGTEFTDAGHIQAAETMIDEMVAQLRNHPCAVIYGVGNECNLKNAEAGPFFRGIISRIRKADPTRLVSYAALYGLVGELAGLVDVLGVNSYWGWYDKCMGGKGLQPDGNVWQKSSGVQREPIDLSRMREMIDKVLAGNSSTALLLTEFGADSVPGYLAAGRDLWSEDYHADLLAEVLSLAKEYPRIVGTFPFCFTDYRDPSKVASGYWDELNLKGVVDNRRMPKKAFYSLRECYGAKD
jgi:beta-glucuronidase